MSTGAGPVDPPPADDEGGDDGDPEMYDVGDGQDGGPGDEEQGCEQVDFLFIVDNSGSMSDEQDELAESFPSFIDTIRNTVAADSYNVMVIDTDEFQEMPPECVGPCAMFPDDPCGGRSCESFGGDPNSCEAKLGGGLVSSAAGTSCGFNSGASYMDDSETDMESKFACAAQRGAEGDGYERPIEAMLTSLGEEHQDPGGCNDGFLRRDSVLVVTLITDEEDGEGDGADVDPWGEPSSPGTPTQWKEWLVDLKDGREDHVVMLGIVSDADAVDVPAEDAICFPYHSVLGTVAPAPRLREFVSSFEYNVLGSICAQDFAPFFDEAVEAIDQACDDFVPEG